MTHSQSSTAWIFLAIARSDGGSLEDFFAAADHINVAIPSDREIENAVNRLCSSGLVEVIGNRFSLTGRGSELFERVGGYSEYPRRQPEMIEPLLRKALGSTMIKSDWHVDPAETAAALRQYSTKHSKA